MKSLAEKLQDLTTEIEDQVFDQLSGSSRAWTKINEAIMLLDEAADELEKEGL